MNLFNCNSIEIQLGFGVIKLWCKITMITRDAYRQVANKMSLSE